MASQINITPQQVPSSAAQDKLKSLRSLDEGKSSGVTVRVARKREELDFMSANDVTSVDTVIVDEQIASIVLSPYKHEVKVYFRLIFLKCTHLLEPLQIMERHA